MLAALLKGLVLGFPNAALPGPFQAYILSQVLQNGWRRTLVIALAPLVSDGPIITLNLLVLSQLPGFVLGIIQMVGGLFIVYLAYGAYKAIKNGPKKKESRKATGAGVRGFFKGVAMNCLSPGPYIFWGTVGGPILLNAWRTSPLNGIAFLVGMYGTLLTGFAILIRIFGTAAGLGPKAGKVLGIVSVVALAGFGLYQLGVGIVSLVS